MVGGGVFNSLPNVKEHATLSAGASVDHRVGVEATEDHVNRAADRGCCVSSCSLLLVIDVGLHCTTKVDDVVAAVKLLSPSAVRLEGVGLVHWYEKALKKAGINLLPRHLPESTP